MARRPPFQKLLILLGLGKIRERSLRGVATTMCV